MDGREIEPRTVLWAVAEISWKDTSGAPCRAPATLEDLSNSGACIRVKQPFKVGSHVTIRWQREQFTAVARNCRSDGRGFLLGVRREGEKTSPAPVRLPDTNPGPSAKATQGVPAGETNPAPAPPPQPVTNRRNRERFSLSSIPAKDARSGITATARAVAGKSGPSTEAQTLSQSQGASPRHERKAMQSKPLFPKFWRRQPAGSVPQQSNSKEVPVNKPNTPAVESLAVPGADLPSYEDIYHAAGILSPPSGYSIHKVVEMLNGERLRDLSQDVKRASVLMALDAAGTSVDDLLQDATRRQQALDSYEAGKKKQMEDFESRKAQESAQIEAEMERIRAHYGERIRHNQDLIAQEKAGLHNWQMAMQHESQRIAEVIDLCGKHPMPAASNPASPAISGKMEKPPSTPESTRSAASGRSS